jgi:hypothetical protein
MDGISNAFAPYERANERMTECTYLSVHKRNRHFVLHLAVGTRVQIFNFRNSHLPHILILNIQIFFFVDSEDVKR